MGPAAVSKDWPLLLAVALLVWLARSHARAAIRWLGQRPRALGIATLALIVLVLAFAAVPTWFVPDSSTLPELYKARSDVRATAVQALAGIVVLLGAYFTWRQLHTAREGQVTERFTRAIDQLGNAQLDIRLGGIYALERIARDSEPTGRPSARS